MDKGIATAAILFALCSFAAAQTDPSELSWQEIREHQPANLHLKISLLKTEYAKGEKIDAMLDYSNDDLKTPYYLTVGGEGPGGVFCAEDAESHLVADPREWLRRAIIMMGGGLSWVNPLGAYHTTLPINANVRFDRPGHYLLYSEEALSKDRDGPSSVWIVSDKIPIDIIPLGAGREKQIIADALSEIGTADSPETSGVREGLEALTYLQTSSAREAVLPFLAKPRIASIAGQVFLQATDPAKESARILEAVKQGSLILDQDGIYVYGEAKAYTPPPQSTAKTSQKERRDQFMIIYGAQKAAQSEIVDAMVAASGQGGPNQVRVLWTAFETEPHGSIRTPDPDGGVLRAAVAKHQLELTRDEIQQLFSYWNYWGSDDFLPIVRREATASNPNLYALLILADRDPVAARPLVLKELSQPGSDLFTPDVPDLHRLQDYPQPDFFLTIQPLPLPEADALLRTKLEEGHEKIGPVLPVICCFGSRNLLPDVLASYHNYHWNEGWMKMLLSYTFRAGPKKAMAAFTHEVELHNPNSQFLINQLYNRWNDQALPVVLIALKQSDPKLVLDAAIDLQAHGNATTVEPIISALERFQATKDTQKVADIARSMLLKPPAPCTESQKKRLEVLAALAPERPLRILKSY